ncbi:MAG: hypothetical protein ACOYK9_06025 [Chlamydiia bacterium]
MRSSLFLIIPFLFFFHPMTANTEPEVDQISTLLEVYSDERKELITEAIYSCLDKLDPFIRDKFCLYGLGSLASNTITPQSDVEFGIFTEIELEKEAFFPFLDALDEALRKKGIFLDTNGSIPKFIKNGKHQGSLIFCTTAHCLIEKLKYNRILFPYLFYSTTYIFGEKRLYEEFIQERGSLHLAKQRAYYSEMHETFKKNFLIRQLLHGITVYRENEKWDIGWNYKYNLIRPLVDLLNYFSFLVDFNNHNPFEQIQHLEKQEILTPDLAKQLRLILANSYKHRILEGDKIFYFAHLNQEETGYLHFQWKTILEFEDLLKKQLSVKLDSLKKSHTLLI